MVNYVDVVDILNENVWFFALRNFEITEIK